MSKHNTDSPKIDLDLANMELRFDEAPPVSGVLQAVCYGIMVGLGLAGWLWPSALMGALVGGLAVGLLFNCFDLYKSYASCYNHIKFKEALDAAIYLKVQEFVEDVQKDGTSEKNNGLKVVPKDGDIDAPE